MKLKTRFILLGHLTETPVLEIFEDQQTERQRLPQERAMPLAHDSMHFPLCHYFFSSL